MTTETTPHTLTIVVPAYAHAFLARYSDDPAEAAAKVIADLVFFRPAWVAGCFKERGGSK